MTIRELLEDRGITQKEFAAQTDLSGNQISRLISGDLPLSPETAIQLETALGVPAQFWNNLEAIYRENW